SSIPVSATNFWTVTDAYNAAKVLSSPQIIGIYTPSTENIVIDTYAGSSMYITECGSQHIPGRNQGGAKETGADKTLPLWQITSNKPVTIVGPSALGNGSICWDVESNGNTLKSVRADGCGTGILVAGNNNLVRGTNDVGSTTPNSGDGIDVTGNNN